MGIIDDLHDDIIAAFPDIASPAVYRPKAAGEAGDFLAADGGQAIETWALIENEQEERGPRANTALAEVRIIAKDVPDPQVDDTVDVDGVTWTCRQSPSQQIVRRKVGPFWVVRVFRAQSPNWRRG